MATKNMTYDLMTNELTKMAEAGRLTKSTFVSLRATLSRILKTVYGDDWKRARLDEIRVDELWSQYVKRVNGRYGSRYMIVMKSRLKRIFRILECGDPMEPHREQPADMATRAFLQSVELVQGIFMMQFGDKLFGNDRKESCNYYVLPTEECEGIGLIIPKGLDVSRLQKAEKMFNSVLLYEYYRQKGGKAMQDRLQDQK